MKSYTEKRGLEKFDWREALTSQTINWLDLANRSKSWVACACGNLCDVIPRDTEGAPVDKTLKALGGDQGFHYAIRMNDAEDALAILDLIEERSAYLIRKERDNLFKKLESLKIQQKEIEEMLLTL